MTQDEEVACELKDSGLMDEQLEVFTQYEEYSSAMYARTGILRIW